MASLIVGDVMIKFRITGLNSVVLVMRVLQLLVCVRNAMLRRLGIHRRFKNIFFFSFYFSFFKMFISEIAMIIGATSFFLLLLWFHHFQKQNPNNMFKVNIIHSDGQFPQKGSDRSVGWDIYSRVNITIEPFEYETVMTGITATPPIGSYLRIAPRSGLASKKGIDVGAGVVDPDYTGEIGVVLFNLNREPFTVRKGDRIAQMIPTKFDETAKTMMVDFEDNLVEEKTGIMKRRGNRGFGSTGIQ